jgi:acetylornithine deacetylase/succinyl-diaminopimelate desuccinylase-like protein
MTDVAALDAWLAAHEAAQRAFLAELVRVPSDNPPGDCAAHAERTAGLLEAMGLIVERHPVPADVARAHGMVSVTNLVVRQRFGPGPVLALNAHGDVVPPGEGWTQDPYGAAVVDGWMVGRGVAVSKSDIATYAFALRALIETGQRLAGTVELHVTYDEEAGGEVGPARLLATGVSRPDMAIAAGFSYAVVTAHNGCLHLAVEVRGRSAHAARPWTGVDALEAATAVLQALYAHRRTLGARGSAVPGIGAPQLTVGLIEGGINTNVVPDRVTLRLDRRMVPEEDPAAVEAELRALIEAAAASITSARAEVRRVLLAEPLVPATGRLSEVLARHATLVLGLPVGTAGVPLYTDARHYAAAGVPIVLYGAGPRTIEEANAHRADERLRLGDLTAATRVVTAGVAELLAPG